MFIDSFVEKNMMRGPFVRQLYRNQKSKYWKSTKLELINNAIFTFHTISFAEFTYKDLCSI